MWRIIDTMQEFIDRQTGVRSIMCEIAADNAADLPANSADRVFILGTFATAIDTGDIYKINSAGAWILQPSQNAFSNVYTKSEIDSMVNVIYQVMMYYHNEQESTDGTITFYTLGGNVGSLTIYGNGQQQGTPTPDNPVMPTFCGKLVGTDWTIPLTCAGQTTPVYLGQTQTVRRIKKLVLTGEENWALATTRLFALSIPQTGIPITGSKSVECTHFVGVPSRSSYSQLYADQICVRSTGIQIWIRSNDISSVADFKSYLAAQYAAGTPVTVWYVLAEPQTGIINEPLCKIGDYSDELHLTKDDITIPTVSGENTLTVDTELPPSKIIISGE